MNTNIIAMSAISRLGLGFLMLFPRICYCFLPFIQANGGCASHESKQVVINRNLHGNFHHIVKHCQIAYEETCRYGNQGFPLVRYCRKQLLELGFIEVRGQRVKITDDGRKELQAKEPLWVPTYGLTMPTGVTIRSVMEEDPLLDIEVVSDEKILKALNRIRSLHRKEGSEKTVDKLVGDLIEDLQERIDETS